MARVARSTVLELLKNKPFRILPGNKQLTLAFGGIYFASTTLTAKPQLIWETEKGYPRYYVPASTLHQDVGAALEGKSSKSAISVKSDEPIKEGGASAVVEELTIGSRSTTWIRFLDGPLRGLIRFERSEIDNWFEDGKLFAGIKNPYKRIDTAPVSRHIVVKVDGEVVAETNAAVVLHETNLAETYYLPATSIKDWSAIEKSDLRTVCPYKGESWYFSLSVKGKKHENLIWYYQYPTHESAGIEGFISFYRKDFVEIIIDGQPL